MDFLVHKYFLVLPILFLTTINRQTMLFPCHKTDWGQTRQNQTLSWGNQMPHTRTSESGVRSGGRDFIKFAFSPEREWGNHDRLTTLWTLVKRRKEWSWAKSVLFWSVNCFALREWTWHCVVLDLQSELPTHLCFVHVLYFCVAVVIFFDKPDWADSGGENDGIFRSTASQSLSGSTATPRRIPPCLLLQTPL